MEKDKYVLGFNHAYILLDKQPEVAALLTAIKSESDYILGFKDGISQYLFEVFELGRRKGAKENKVERKTESQQNRKN